MSSERQVACITGGTSGIGKALALRLLDEGWLVFAVGRSAKHAEQMKEELSDARKSSIHIRYADLREYSACVGIASEIERVSNHLNLLVNAAGTIGAGGVLSESPERWELVISSNLNPAFNMSKACADLLARGDDASIINVSSVCSLRPCGSVAYSVSKAGLDMLTISMAKELASKGIRVNSVNPSVVRTNLQKSAGLFADEPSYEQWVMQMKATHPLGRVGEPEDIVDAIMYLKSPGASWVTGAILSVDGGRGVA